MKVVKSPEPFSISNPKNGIINVFLGGSIDMGEAENWQEVLTEALSDQDDVVVLNPRRDDWDSSWIQDPTPGTKFHEQVSWELNAQDNSNVLVYYFSDNSKSPITLMELGLYAHKNQSLNSYGEPIYVVVRCNENFYRYGNVKIVCDRFGIPCVESMEELINTIKGC